MPEVENNKPAPIEQAPPVPKEVANGETAKPLVAPQMTDAQKKTSIPPRPLVGPPPPTTARVAPVISHM